MFKKIFRNIDISKYSAGFTLIETLVGIAIFSIVSVSIYFSYSNILNTIIISQFNLTALTILDNEMEQLRNMPYQDVGVLGGAPAGVLLAEKNVVQGQASFTVQTIVRSIDDPFDGKIGQVPNDLAPADYKLVELEARCGACQFAPVKLTGMIAPKNLEGATNNGALFINVFNAFGQSVDNANVQIINNQISPPININDLTNVNGQLQLVDIATSSSGYEISVTKNGYTWDRTYPFGGIGNPNPLKPHASVAKQEVTTISFSIDKVSAVHFKTADQFCAPVPNIDFSQQGAKLIGTDPDVLKYSIAGMTDLLAGYKRISGLEWDTYDFQNLDSVYDIGGMSLLVPLVVDPAATLSFSWVMEPKSPMAELVTVSNASGQSISDAQVTLSKAGFSESHYTGRKEVNQTDWSAGKYTEKSQNLEADSPAGEIRLASIGSKYASASEEWLISSTTDFGTTDLAFYNLQWRSVSQPVQSGPDSLKIQLASNNDNSTWNFVGPDGTAGTFYTLSDTVINSVHNGKRYLRYKVFLKTDDENFTPRLENLSISFRSGCVPSGQAYFSGLTSGTYTMTIEKAGYQIFSDTGLFLTQNWQEYRAVLSP